MQLTEIFPGRFSLTPVEAGFAWRGLKPQTVRNQLNEKRFKLPLTEIGDSQVVLISDLQAIIDARRSPVAATRRGPKTKAEKFASGGDHE